MEQKQKKKRLSEKGNKKHRTKKENREERIEKKELSMFFLFLFIFFTLFLQEKIYNPQFATLRAPSQQIANCITTILINEKFRQGLILSKGKLLL